MKPLDWFSILLGCSLMEMANFITKLSNPSWQPDVFEYSIIFIITLTAAIISRKIKNKNEPEVAIAK